MVTRARRKLKEKQNFHREETALLEALSSALSEEEIQRMLACALLALDGAGRRRLIERLGKETGETLGELLGARKRKKQRPGRAKVRQEWDRAWGEWQACVDESGDKGGRYVYQEHHWESPYLDAGALTHDLETIAVQMRKLVPRVMEDDLDPELSFAEALAQTAEEIGSGLPEWMDNPEGYDFGPEVTGCLLDWEWRAAQRNGLGAFELADRICKLDRSLNAAGLDQDAIAGYVLGLGDKHTRNILKGITDNRSTGHWADVLGRSYSGWFRMYRDLTRRWDPDLFVAISRANIAQNWELALPLVKDLLHRKAFEEARSLIEEAVHALLRLDPGESWDPREGLLIEHPTQRYRTDINASRVQLLKDWHKTATGLDREELACALELQTVVSANREDWDAVVGAFRRVQKPELASMCDRLFSDWKSMIAKASIGAHTDGGAEPEQNWIHGLADAARAGDDGGAFHKTVRDWLKYFERTPESLGGSLLSLGKLTLDLDPGSRLKNKAPILHRLLSRYQGGKDLVHRSRRQLVGRLRGAELFPEVLQFWKRNAPSLVPDPAQARGSSYGDCADWAAAVFELDRQAYDRIVLSWSKSHKRRRNLWQALKKKQLPLKVKS